MHGEKEGRFNVLPWYRLVGVAKTSSETQGGKDRAARSGKWPPRGAGMTVLTYPGIGEMCGSSPWTRPSAPSCGDTLKALARDQHLI